MPPDRFSRRGRLAVIPLTVVAAFAVLAPLTVGGYLLVVANRPPAGVGAEQDRLLSGIRAFHAQHGRLPDTLEEAGITFDSAVFDSVWYSKAFDNPHEFTLFCQHHYWNPTPATHEWSYSSTSGDWEYHRAYT
jgi:hypothetical protein